MHINIMSEFEKVHTHCHNGHVAVIYGFVLRLGTPYSVLTDLVVFPFLSLSYQINL